jgi:putative membrane protein
MMSHNSLFRGGWTFKKFQATIINDIYPEVLFFTLVATGTSRTRMLMQILIGGTLHSYNLNI